MTRHRAPIQAVRYAASTNHYLATAAALRVLHEGGNAVDAGVAAGLCVNVVQPDLTSFGGVAPIVVFDGSSGEARVVSGVGHWGREATVERLVQLGGGGIPPGVLRSVVPAAPDAWLTALERFGTWTFADTVAPALELARDGFPVYSSLHRNIESAAPQLGKWPSSAAIFLPDGRVPAVGQRLVQGDLARMFERLVEEEEHARAGGDRRVGIRAARDAFYRGSIAATIADFVSGEGGFVSREDLGEFRVDVEAPATTTYRDTVVHACGVWSQGPAMLETLNFLEGFAFDQIEHNSADYIHLVSQALNLAFADREAHYGDPRFRDVPLGQLLSKEYAERQRARIRPDRAWLEMPEAGRFPEEPPVAGRRAVSVADGDTSYVAVIDADGNAFSATPSDGFAATPIVPGLGLVCSGRGSQSWLDEDHPSSVQARKRPRLTPNPALVLRGGRLWMAFGTPGADMQVQAMVQVLLNILEYGLDPQEAVEAARFGSYSPPSSFWPHESRPGVLKVEGRIPPRTVAALAARGHEVEVWPEWTRVAGSVCVVMVDHENGTLIAGADPRAEAYAMGW